MHWRFGELSFSLSQIWPGGHGTGLSIPMKGHIEPFGHYLQIEDPVLSW